MNLTAKGRRQLKRHIENRVARIYGQRCSGIQIGILDTPKVMAVGEKAVSEGLDDQAIGDRIAAFVETIRKN